MGGRGGFLAPRGEPAAQARPGGAAGDARRGRHDAVSCRPQAALQDRGARGFRRHRRRRHRHRGTGGDARRRSERRGRGAGRQSRRRHRRRQARHRRGELRRAVREMMYYIVTGAAGFIGSKLVEGLNRRGITEIIAVDNLAHADKFRNLSGCEIADYVDQAQLPARLDSLEGSVEAVLHQGACSDTLETDGRFMMDNNYAYSRRLLEWCQEEEVPLLYASSASVYGSGPDYREERACERPLNIYGYSKFLFDQLVRSRLGEASAQIVGLRYFNVYGPNEAHKGRMASVALHAHQQLHNEGKVKLFVGADGYRDGEQRRDFVYVDDVVAVNLWFLERRTASGIFNCGTGRAQTFNRIAVAVINAVHGTSLTLHDAVAKGLIEYIAFPAALVGKYQSFTEADLSKLRAAGYPGEFMTVEQGVSAYVKELQRK